MKSSTQTETQPKRKKNTELKVQRNTEEQDEGITDKLNLTNEEKPKSKREPKESKEPKKPRSKKEPKESKESKESKPRKKKATENGHTENGHTENGHTENGHTENGHTENGHTETNTQPKKTTKKLTKKSTKKSKLTETQAETQPETQAEDQPTETQAEAQPETQTANGHMESEAQDEKKKSKKEPKKKRTLNEKQTSMEKTGISIGPARVKDVLMNIALNNEEFKLRELLLQPKSKIRALSSEEDSASANSASASASTETQTTPSQTTPSPTLDSLSEEYKTLIREAEESYEYSLLESYEKEYYNSLLQSTETDSQKKYREAKKAFKRESEEKNTEFSLYDFLATQIKNFEHEFEEFKYFRDNYAIRSKDDPKFDRVRAEYEVKRVKNILKDENKNNKAIKEKYAGYNNKRAEAEQAAGSAFNLKEFNLSFDADFYKNFEKYDAVKRSIVLVSKTGIRISSNGRNIIACFLDRIVQQYATNAITNCILKQKHIVRLRHALIKGENFKSLVPLYPFVNTLQNYDLAVQHVLNANSETLPTLALPTLAVVSEAAPAVVSEAAPAETSTTPATAETLTTPASSAAETKQRKKMKKQNRFEGHAYGRVFYGYINEICRYVKLNFVNNCSEEEKSLYLETSISKEFKHFCSFIVNETIFRIGNMLKKYVKQQGVKTISDGMVSLILEQIHLACGIDYEQTEQQMNKQLEKFNEWKEEKKTLKQKKLTTPAVETS